MPARAPESAFGVSRRPAACPPGLEMAFIRQRAQEIILDNTDSTGTWKSNRADALIQVRDYVGLLYLMWDSAGYPGVPAEHAKFTVPSGRYAVLMQSEYQTETAYDPNFQGGMLWNQSRGVPMDSLSSRRLTTFGTYNQRGVTAAGPYPVIGWAATLAANTGETVTALAFTSGDGFYRLAGGLWILAMRPNSR